MQRSAAAFNQAPDDNNGYLVLERDGGPLTDGDKAFYDRVVADLRSDPGRVTQAVDWGRKRGGPNALTAPAAVGGEPCGLRQARWMIVLGPCADHRGAGPPSVHST